MAGVSLWMAMPTASAGTEEKHEGHPRRDYSIIRGTLLWTKASDELAVRHRMPPRCAVDEASANARFDPDVLAGLMFGNLRPGLSFTENENPTTKHPVSKEAYQRLI